MLSKLFSASYEMYKSTAREQSSRNDGVIVKVFDFKADKVPGQAGGCSCSNLCCCSCANGNGNCNSCCAYVMDISIYPQMS